MSQNFNTTTVPSEANPCPLDANPCNPRNPCLGEVTFSAADHKTIAALLEERIACSDFFSGTIATSHDGFEARLVATLIIYRTPRSPSPPSGGEIYSVVPVWWEMHTYLPDGREVMNDFELRALYPLLVTTPPPIL